MAVEQAQHLIAMSLGKMAVSRNQRGGANLHRSLLVATVLHKARTTIMMENFQAMMQQRRAQMEAQQQQRVEEEQLAACPQQSKVQETCRVQEEAVQDQENQENCPPQQHQQHHDNNNNSSCVLTTSYNNSSNILTPLVTSTSDNKPSPLQESTESNNKSNCARCLKRRVTELGPADDVYDAKRLKYESDSELSHDTSSRADCALATEDDEEEEEEETQEVEYPQRSQTPEPMQTDPVQITNLVHRFNSGLSGLLSQVVTEQAQQQQQCNSEQQFTSCCTQVMDSGIESLSRPCIALTV